MPKVIKITKKVAKKILATVDAGLVKGIGVREPGKMCVEAAVCYALGLPHGDDPACVATSLRALKIRLNDSNWSSDQARAKGMRKLAVLQLGTAGVLDEKEFIRRIGDMTIRKIVPRALLSAAGMKANAAHKGKLESAAKKCAEEGSRESAWEAKNAAYAAANATNATYAAADAYAAADHAADAYAAYAAADAADAYAAYAAADAADAAYAAADHAADAYAAYAAADAAADAADAAYAAADAADAYAAYAAADAADAAYAAADAAYARDKSLAFFADEVAQILIDMKVPGVKWLDLLEKAERAQQER